MLPALYGRPDLSGYSGQGTGPPARVGVPGTGMDALRRQPQLEPAGEVDGDQGRDVGDAVSGAANPGTLGQALVEEPEEALHARPAALGQGRDLRHVLGPGQSPPTQA